MKHGKIQRMGLSELLTEAPGQRTYSRLVLDAVLAGAARPEWSTITIRRAGHVAVLDVLAVPLQLDDGAGGRVVPMFSATLQQLVLDQLGALLPTPLVMDEMWKQASARVPPSPPLIRNWYLDNSLGTPAHMMEQSDTILSLLSRMPPGIVALPWKSWVLDARFRNNVLKVGVEQAFNHGLYLEDGGQVTPGGCHVIEKDDGGHDRLWGDYSQVGLGMRGIVIVDDKSYATADVLRDPELSKVLTYDGPLGNTRQPGAYDVHSFDTR